MKLFILVLLTTVCHLSAVSSQVAIEPCKGVVEDIGVDTSGGIIYSRGYPNDYFNSDSCFWKMSAPSSYVVQIKTVDIQVEEQYKECVDYLAAYDGPDNTYPLLRKWCGTDHAVVQSTQQNLYLEFRTSQSKSQKGFAIEYHAIKPYNMTCTNEAVKTVPVSKGPIHFNFQMEKGLGVCQWRFEPEGSGSERLILTLESFAGYIRCNIGYLAFYDGDDTTAPEIFRLCDFGHAPFSSFYPSRSALMVIQMVGSEADRITSLQIGIVAKTRSFQEVCDQSQIPTIEVPDFSLFMALPYAASAGGSLCPLMFYRAGRNVRVDVTHEDGQKANCNSYHSVSVQSRFRNTTQSEIPECWRDERPMFLSTSVSDVIVTPATGKTAIIQVSSLDYPCTGYVIDETTYQESYKRKITSNSDTIRRYQSNAVCRFLFTPRDEGDYPFVQFEWDIQFPGKDMIRIYNGNSSSDPLLGELNERTGFGDGFVASSRQAFVEFSSDDNHNYGFITITYYSVPVADYQLRKEIELVATSAAQNLTSINYPNYYPISFTYTYIISTGKEGDVIHLDVVDGDFGLGCSDYLNIFDGSSIIYGSPWYLGKVCPRTPSQKAFESKGRKLTVEFVSDDKSSFSGWRLLYRSAPPTDSEAENENTAAIVGGVLGVIIFILLIVIIVLVVRGHRKGAAPVYSAQWTSD